MVSFLDTLKENSVTSTLIIQARQKRTILVSQ